MKARINDHTASSSLMKVANKKVFMTGGSVGIGKFIIEELINHSANDIAVMGRTSGKLGALEEQFPSVEFLKIQGDISILDDVKKAEQTVKKQWNNLDILINNAGAVSVGLLEEISDEAIINQVRLM